MTADQSESGAADASHRVDGSPRADGSPRDERSSAPQAATFEVWPGTLVDRVFFYFLYFIGAPLVRFFFPMRVIGRAPLRSSRPILLAPNHVSFLDPVFLQAAVPARITYMMTEIYYGIPLLNWVFRRLGCIPVPREGSQLALIRRGLAALDTRRLVAIFPEGQRTTGGALGPGFPGVSMLATRANALVVPVAISGADRAMPRGKLLPLPSRIEVRFGEAIDFAAMPRMKTQQKTDVIMERIRALMQDGRRKSRTTL